MPSGLRRRIGRLEGPGGGRCRQCGGVGHITIVHARKGQTVEDARGCPACGKVSKYIVLERRGG